MPYCVLFFFSICIFCPLGCKCSTGRKTTENRLRHSSQDVVVKQNFPTRQLTANACAEREADHPQHNSNHISPPRPPPINQCGSQNALTQFSDMVSLTLRSPLKHLLCSFFHPISHVISLKSFLSFPLRINKLCLPFVSSSLSPLT